jgi:hypothetical protein
MTNIIIHDIVSYYNVVCFIDKNKIDYPVSLVVFSKITFWIISDEVDQRR